jgi:Flp pilus assembly protein TadG
MQQPHRRRESGSVLMLMPAAVLIVMVLGAIAVDLSVVRMGQRELIAAAGDAANDAVTIGLDEAALRAGDGYRLDAERVRDSVEHTLAAKGMLDDLAEPPVVTIDGETTVTVQLARRVPHLFAKALPGAPDDQLVRATVTAEVEQR